MGIFESIFDITYLVIVISLGVRLLLEKGKGAKIFALMAILLGLGDSFHLIPRVMAHFSLQGFPGYTSLLSWGKFITSITMTIFYVLYYHYLEEASEKKSKTKKLLIYLLALVRIILVLLPQNNWGSANESYMMGIYRNISFTIMGVLLIIWSNKNKDLPGLKHMDLLIFLSFLFYAPVVLFADKYPPLGALMMPKTVAYLLIVILGFKTYVKDFSRKNILSLAFAFLIMGLAGGVFYREFTKFNNFTGRTHLLKVHPHALVLGFIFLLVLYLLTKDWANMKVKTLQKPMKLYIAGLSFTIINMLALGIFEVVDPSLRAVSLPALNGLSGLDHIALGVGLVQVFLKFYKSTDR